MQRSSIGVLIEEKQWILTKMILQKMKNNNLTLISKNSLYSVKKIRISVSLVGISISRSFFEFYRLILKYTLFSNEMLQ